MESGNPGGIGSGKIRKNLKDGVDPDNRLVFNVLDLLECEGGWGEAEEDDLLVEIVLRRQVAQPLGGGFRGDVALGHAEHLVTDHEFPDRCRAQ